MSTLQCGHGVNAVESSRFAGSGGAGNRFNVATALTPWKAMLFWSR